MIYPRQYTNEEIELIVSGLQKLYPDLQIRLYFADKRFIRITRVIATQRVDTIPISLVESVDIHLSEAETLLKEKL
jgi:hypothetical protein